MKMEVESTTRSAASVFPDLRVTDLLALLMVVKSTNSLRMMSIPCSLRVVTAF